LREGEITITKEQMIAGLCLGRRLTQEHWAHPKEIEWVDELVSGGLASATEWKYSEWHGSMLRRISWKQPTEKSKD
jgi:hypothetical protein